MVLPREQVKDRFYRVFTYQDVDRVPDIEFGYWPQTIRRWLDEGMPVELEPEETTDMFSRKVDDFFGFEHEGHSLPGNTGMNPPFEEVILERRTESAIIRDATGIVAERYLHDSGRSSIPRFIEFPVKTPGDWVQMKERYRLGDPMRMALPEDIDAARKAQAAGKSMRISFSGFYGQLRHWMGMENLSYAFYDYPQMIHDMVTHWAELCARQIEQLPSDLAIDQVDWWEDMASKNGPLVSPTTFREVLQPGYRRVMTAAKRRGCVLAMVDCDGNPHDIVANWLEEGVNIMFPLEVSAGVDPYAWRKEFGGELRLRGGIAKRPLVEGGKAIDRELDRLRPLLEQGGCIPHLDHLVPPDIPYVHYCEYLDKKRRFIGR
jgi:uroporphyrinogen decarboxylase-like protein